MSAAARLVAFAAVLGVLFGGGALAGAAIGPDRDAPSAEPPGTGTPASDGALTRPGSHGNPDAPKIPQKDAAHGGPRPVRGLAVAENGLRLVVADPELRRGRSEAVRFRIVDRDGETMRDFDVEHTKRMHLIVARRDLSGFQHLHPVQDRDGGWSVPLRLARAGSYRLFADFSNKGVAYTLATDLRVDGRAELRPLPAASPTSVSDGGFDVRLDAGSPRSGQEATLRFRISKDGEPIGTQPYLGAAGHLVALREGDLAFLHVHPVENVRDDSVAFAATFPSEGAYRLFLQFKYSGRVQTVAFTQEVE